MIEVVLGKMLCGGKQIELMDGRIEHEGTYHYRDTKGGRTMINLLEGLAGLVWKFAKYVIIAIILFYALLLVTAW